MIISSFNRFFAKHGKKTYIALGVIISAMFVIFVTPGKNDMSCSDSNKIGEIYGEPLLATEMPAKLNKTRVALWLDTPQYFGMETNLDDFQMVQYMLHNIRRKHLADAYNIPVPTKEEIFEYLKTFPIFVENGEFNQERFNYCLNFVADRYGVTGAEFDQLTIDAIRYRELEKKLTEDIVLTDEELNAAFTNYRLMFSRVALDPSDSTPKDEEVAAFFEANKAKLAMPASRNAEIAIFSIDDCLAAINAGNIPADLADQIVAGDDKQNRTKVFQYLRGKADALKSEFSKKVTSESAEALKTRFAEEAGKNGAKVIETGLLLSGAKIADLAPALQSSLSNRISGLSEVGAVSNLSVADNCIALAILIDIKDTPVPEALDASNMEIIRNLMIRSKALEYFETQLKTPFEAAKVESNKVMQDENLTNDEKMARIDAMDSALPQLELAEFYVPAKRDFAYVTVPKSMFAAKITPITDEMIQAEFDAMTKEEGKTLDDYRDEIVTRLTDEQTTAMAADKAIEISNSLSDAWWNAKDTDTSIDCVAEMNKLAASHLLAAANQVTALSDRETSASIPAEVVSTIRVTNAKSPISGAIRGKDAVYVACLLKVEEPTLSDPNTDQTAMNTLMSTYRRKLEMDAAAVKATAITADLQSKLDAGEDITKLDYIFTELPLFMQADLYKDAKKFEDIMVKANLTDPAILDILDVTPAKRMLAPQPAMAARGRIQLGYNLLYLAAKEVAIEDVDQETIQTFKDNMLEQKKQNILYGIYENEVTRSNTVLDKRMTKKGN